MKLPSIGGIHNSFPAAWLNLFNAVTIVILLPIMEKIIYPWFSKRGYHIIPLTRISIGKFEVGKFSIYNVISCLPEFLLFYCAVLITNSLTYSSVQVVLELIRPQLTSLGVVLVLPHHLETLSKIITKLCTEKHAKI